jgi:predicted transcriptional regulator
MASLRFSAPSGPVASQTLYKKMRFTSVREIEYFRTLGLDEKSAMCLIALNELKNASSKDLQAICRLRQPEISIALKRLKSYGWIGCSIDKNAGAGRPKSIYFLNERMTEIIRSLHKRIEEEFAGRSSAAEALISFFDDGNTIFSTDKGNIRQAQK